MPNCNNAGTTLLYGHTMPKEYNQILSYKSEINSQCGIVSVKARKKPNGPLVNIKFNVHKKLHGNLAAIFDEIAKNPNIAINDYIGSLCIRPINNPSKKGSTVASLHSVGTAVDINYDLNGFIPPDGKPDSTYIMRTKNHPIVQAFLRHGWSWGGLWSCKSKDYMHFEFITGDSKYLNGEFASDNFETSGGSDSNESRAFSFESSGSGATYNGGTMSFINNSPNTVYQLASNGEKANTLKINDDRKNQFTSLRETLKGNMLNMGRDIIESPEMYNSSILKSSQSAKTLRTPQTNQNKTEEKKSESA